MTTLKIAITGSTRGLGMAMCDGFAARGHQVFGCGRSTNKIQALQTTFGPPHDFSSLDVSNDPAVSKWASQILTQYGPPDLLINNAALMNENAPLWEIPPNEFSNLIDVNIKGVFHVIRHFLPAMLAQKKGVIVNFSSTWGQSTSPLVAPYCASKWAIEGLSQSLAQELPPGMACIALNPGIIHTKMLETCFGTGASGHWKPKEWATVAVPLLLNLKPEDNGKTINI